MFLLYLLWEPDWNPGGKSHNIVLPRLTVPLLEFPTPALSALRQLRAVRAFSSSSVTAQVSRAGTGSAGSLHLWASALLSCNSLYISVNLSIPWGSRFPCVLASFMDLRRVVDFSIRSSFYLLLGQCGDFQDLLNATQMVRFKARYWNILQFLM